MAVYHGLQPFGPVLRQRRYPVVTAVGTSLFKGDPVTIVNDGTVAIATGGHAPNLVLGSVLSVLDSNLDPISYLPSGTVGDGTFAGYVIVADHPLQEYVVPEDADTSQLALADCNINIDLVAGSGDTTTGLSGWLLDSNTATATNTYQMRLVRLAPIEGNTLYNATTCPNPKWVTTINRHVYGDSTAGI